MDRSRPQGNAGVRIGPAAVARASAVLAAERDGLRIVLQQRIGDGDRVFVLGEYGGRHHVTGEEFCSPFATRWSCWRVRSPSGKRSSTRRWRETTRKVIRRYQARYASYGCGVWCNG